MPEPTSLSRLQRMSVGGDTPDWRRFVDVYEPFLRNWLRRKELPSQDADDLVQNILAVVVRRVKDFEHNGRPGAFRNWLKTIAVFCLKEHWRSQKTTPAGVGGSDMQTLLQELATPNSQASRQWDEDHDRHVMRKLLEKLRDEFEPRTWLAFERFALQSRSAAEVAQELGISANAVFIAKSRVLTRLRRESAGLLDE